jgi:tRNA-specific 2-thiouridylase
MREGERMRVVVAMSGGVDSTVAAWLLVQRGVDVVGVFLRNGVEQRGRARGCCGAVDALDAAECAGRLGIPFYALDQSVAFGRLIGDFVAAYARGETPNPCVQCNRDLKFGELLHFAGAIGAQRLATGHYARVAAAGGEVVLRRALDIGKDQSYVLASVDPAALSRAWFPLGDLRKEEVRRIAREAGLPVHAKPESQEICFVPGGDHRDLLRERRPELFRTGHVVEPSGRVVGNHGGAAGFTVGQRRGLGLAVGEPRYVLAVDPARNLVEVGTREQLLGVRARLDPARWWMGPPRDGETIAARLQVRAHHRPVAATARVADGGAIDVDLAPPGEAITPGQLGVLYDGDRVIAAGTLRRA